MTPIKRWTWTIGDVVILLILSGLTLLANLISPHIWVHVIVTFLLGMLMMGFRGGGGWLLYMMAAMILSQARQSLGWWHLDGLQNSGLVILHGMLCSLGGLCNVWIREVRGRQ